jgi:hypothetical protein
MRALIASIAPHSLMCMPAVDRPPHRPRGPRDAACVAGFAGAVALALLAIGPWAMDLLFGSDFDYGRGGLALVALGRGCPFAAGTLNQAALARGRQPLAALAWAVAAVGFVVWLVISVVSACGWRRATSAPRPCCARCSRSSTGPDGQPLGVV